MYPKIQKVLFASDLTENSRRTFRYAASMGMHYKIGIVLLHVIEKIPVGIRLRLAGLEAEEALRRLREEHEEEVRRILIGKKHDSRLRQTLVDFYSLGKPEDAHADYEIQDILIKEGDIAEEILNSAAEHGCGMIVMGSHRGLLGANALGSAARTVLHRSQTPVLIVPPQVTA